MLTEMWRKEAQKLLVQLIAIDPYAYDFDELRWNCTFCREDMYEPLTHDKRVNRANLHTFIHDDDCIWKRAIHLVDIYAEKTHKF